MNYIYIKRQKLMPSYPMYPLHCVLSLKASFELAFIEDRWIDGYFLLARITNNFKAETDTLENDASPHIKHHVTSDILPQLVDCRSLIHHKWKWLKSLCQHMWNMSTCKCIKFRPFSKAFKKLKPLNFIWFFFFHPIYIHLYSTSESNLWKCNSPLHSNHFA